MALVALTIKVFVNIYGTSVVGEAVVGGVLVSARGVITVNEAHSP